jgi:hypothetical protein
MNRLSYLLLSYLLSPIYSVDTTSSFHLAKLLKGFDRILTYKVTVGF